MRTGTKTRIGVFTATRAEYGLLRPLLERLDSSDRLEPHLIVSGTHLSPRHGMTVSEIEADGRPIAARIPVPLAADDGVSVAQDMAAVLADAAEAYATLRLDAVLILGDRTEALRLRQRQCRLVSLSSTSKAASGPKERWTITFVMP